MNTWKWLGKVCSSTPGTKRINLKLYYAWKSKQYQRFYARQCETQPHTVVFEAFMGKRYACSPKALYEAMMEILHIETGRRYGRFGILKNITF